MGHGKIAVVGAGRLGSSLGFLLAKAGYRIIAVAARSAESAAVAARFIGGGEPMTDAARAVGEAEIVLITTPDRAIRGVCEAIARSGGLLPGTIVVHASGAHTLDLLDSARAVGAFRAVIHPLQAIPSPEQGVRNIPGSFFRIEADPPALPAARDLVRALGGVELEMPGWAPDRQAAALYHAGAVVVSNYLVTLVDFGLRFFQTLGADRRQALRAVLPLLKGTLANLEELGTPAALTGPFARGDGETIRGHLAALRRQAPELIDLYRELARHTVPLALERGGITPQTAEELLRALDE